jgi:hypothetical protein
LVLALDGLLAGSDHWLLLHACLLFFILLFVPPASVIVNDINVNSSGSAIVQAGQTTLAIWQRGQIKVYIK